MLHCSVEPDDVLSMNFMYKWKTSVPGMDIAVADSSTPDVAISIPMGHPSEGEYYCHVYSEDALVGVGSTTLQVQGIDTKARQIRNVKFSWDATCQNSGLCGPCVLGPPRAIILLQKEKNNL